MDLSVVIPVRDEAANVARLVAEICAALDGLLHYEIVYVDDGSGDATGSEVALLQTAIPKERRDALLKRYNAIVKRLETEQRR